MDPNLPRPGDVLCSKYRIEAVLGAGGMGVVLAATDTTLQRPVAIKFLSPGRVANEAAVARFMREARAAAAIESEHVVRVFEVSTVPETGAPFIVMEQLRGADLGQLLEQRGPFSLHEACDLLLETCEALGVAHGRGIVHRDLKPQNLFLAQRPDGSACLKVLDFGISKTEDVIGSQSLTSTDTIMGTPLYMSPEQVRSLKNVDARADIWALGIILFELLTGVPVFVAPTASALCVMIASDPPAPLRTKRPDAPAELEAIVFRCLEKDPAARFQHVGALAGALAHFATERGRQTAARIARLTAGVAPTGMLPSQAMSFGTAPTNPAPTTQTGWQRSTPPIGPTGFVLAGAIGLLAIGGASAAFFHFRTTHEPTVTPAATVSASAAPPPSVSPAIGSASASASAAPPHPSAPSTPKPPKDAGAPSTKDAGAADNRDQERLAQMNEESCRRQMQQMQVFATDDASRKRAATTAKAFMCRGGASTKCELDTCLYACGVLGDSGCLQQYRYLKDFGPHSK